nr:retrovirus-related Pol polyprotein from transposon TNT 1-94 [Tanacetum cinerariifolium]
MKAILRKDKCLAAIGERPAEVTDDSKWDEIDENPISNLHLALAAGVLSSIKEKKSAKEIWDHLARINVLLDYLVFDDVVAVILEEENRHSNREDMQTSSRQVEALVVTRGRSMELSSSGNHNHVVANESEKRFANVWPFDMGATFHMTTKREWFHQYKPISGGGSMYSCNDHELKIIAIRSIMVKMHDDDLGCKVKIQNKIIKIIKGALVLIRGEKVAANLYQLKGEIMEEAEASEMLGVPIKKKSNVFEVFKVYKAQVELDSGKKIKCLRTDNRGDYTGDKFDIFCRQEGIKREFPTTYTPQQNGVVERINKNLLERARAMLETASLGKSFWAEAVNTACYVINRSPSTALDLKSRKCLFLGYADGVKGYRLWDLASHKVVIMEEKIQENEEAAPQHDVNETTKSQAPATRTLNRERRLPGWHSDYVMESNVAYCLLTEDGEPSTLQEALNNPDASSLEYNRLHADPCAYFKRFGNNDFIILRLYVDDMLVAGPNIDCINKLKAQLAREFEMKHLGPANKILGMQIHRDRLSSKMSPNSEKERMDMFRALYAFVVGSVMFAMICTRPKIAHAVGVVSRYMAEPGRQHWKAVKRILRYIKGTSDVALCFGDSDLIVKRYVDSDYAGDLDESKSTTGYVFTLFGRTVSWVLKLQSIMSMSTIEAEYVAAAQASKEAVRLKMLLEELSHE